nr:MAG TPA: tail assembly chaperone protein [Caudoviricetes sp.]
MVILNLDKPRELKFSHKAMRQFSALTKVSVPEMQQAVQRYDLMTTAVYCMLAVQDSSLTPNQVEDMLDELPVLEVYTKAVEAVSEALQGDEDAKETPENEEENPPAAAGAGKEA